MITSMQYLHLCEDPAGISYFQDNEISLSTGDFAPPAPAMPISEPMPCTNLLLLVLPKGWGGAQHPSPCRQIAFCLSGQLQVRAGNGETRTFGAGAIWRMEDVAGSGHTTTVIGDEDVRLAITQLV